MTALKKPIETKPSLLVEETKRFNKRALIGSVVIHLFIFFFMKVPQLQMEHKLKEEPKLIPIEMVNIKPLKKSAVIKNKLDVKEPEKVVPQEKKDAGTAQVVKNSDRLGDPSQKKVQDVQKGDPLSKNKTAYKPGTDFRKLPQTDIGRGAAPTKTPTKDGGGGSGNTYNAGTLANLSDSLVKTGQGVNRIATRKGAKDDGGAGGGSGGGVGDGIGGGAGDGRFTGTTTGTTNPSKILNNVGSLTGSAQGKIDSSRGFTGLSEKGSIAVAGVPIEKIAIPTIDGEAVKRLLREHIPQFRHCYQSELDKKKSGDNLQGRAEFRFSIGVGGRVTRSEVAMAEITDDQVRACIKNVLHGIKFPEPKGGKSVEVTQPMNFALDRI